MNRLYTAACAFTLVAAAAVLIPATADAKETRFSDKEGRFGLGYDASLGNVGGLSARFQVAKAFGIQAIVSFDRIGFDALDQNANALTENSVNNTTVAVRGDVGVAFTRQTSLGIIFGVDIYNFDLDVAELNDSGAQERNESSTQFSFEVGVKAEHHFTDWFSIHGEVGVVFGLVARTTEVDALFQDPGLDPTTLTDPPDPNSVIVNEVDGSVIRFGRGDAVGNFGFTFWFN